MRNVSVVTGADSIVLVSSVPDNVLYRAALAYPFTILPYRADGAWLAKGVVPGLAEDVLVFVRGVAFGAL